MKKTLISLAVITAASGCATPSSDEDRNNTAIGAAVGAVAGAIIGGATADDGNSDREVITGAVLGAAAGAGVGYIMDQQEQEFRDALAAEQARSEIEIERVREDLLKVTFDNEVTFDVDSARVKPAFQSSLDKVADTLVKYGSDATVIGHTDSTGSESYNQDLSDRRANSVRIYLLERGVASAQLSSYGKGELEPRADNGTEAGRQLNRRVEILVRPGDTAAL